MDLLLLCRAESEAVVQELVEGNRGWPLTEAGRRQGDLLGERLARDYHVAALYSSPLDEAWETAGLVGRALGMPARPEPDLREMDGGRLAGRPLEQVRSEMPGLFPPCGDIFSAFPDGESYADMHVRVVKAINGIVAAADDRPVAVVTHPGPIQAFWLAFLRYAIEQRSELKLRCDPASLHHFRRGADGRKEIVRLNDTGHLLLERNLPEPAGRRRIRRATSA
jgi:broad specificity phosphatase PhoE